MLSLRFLKKCFSVYKLVVQASLFFSIDSNVLMVLVFEFSGNVFWCLTFHPIYVV